MIQWTCEHYSQIDRDSLYDALALRQIVFVIEQACTYLDCDGVDRKGWHLLGRKDDGMLVAYSRLLPPGTTYAEPCIGRVVTHPATRREGHGRALMSESIRRIGELFGPQPIRIGAQRYLERFYESFGFAVAGEPYIEDGIPHIQMLRP